MVRFKNRYLLVEFLIPSTLNPTIPNPTSQLSEEEALNLNLKYTPQQADEEVDDEEDDEMGLSAIPKIPFLVPTSQPVLGIGDEQVIYKAVRGCIQDVFGDEGWARVASSFRVIYHSPLTTLTFIRIARPYYRLIWSGLTFLTSLGGKQVIPRVVGVSGTIKKLQNRGISYHRLVVAQLIAHSLSSADEGLKISGGGASAGEKRLDKDGEREREEIGRLTEGQ
ncbi:hypothetical protein L486_07069 [Kwoniella mangroviensis CBS 10435]|uniref:Ribonuclease P/MRP protein subunit POP5 n=1 Tax=Kwoniella mangroviensis CBS 10435 TaxID=1331196 RepID=A0A1B9IJ68_9TREE|nr:hypothetical protein L486_07069 [Kwoniella mangroviensis CBS 10435]OCF73683.1 hypothetical protein I204_05527 [Kwoniella mangroviensis CBS 8886]